MLTGTAAHDWPSLVESLACMVLIGFVVWCLLKY